MSDQLTREVAGGRDAFFENPESDRLLAMMMRFMADHWALRERVETLETLLREHDVLPADAVEHFTPSSEQDSEWDMESYRFIQAVVAAGKNIRR